ncbi:TetR/AcrR family transcriptional regulator [[Clostridium] symbiosum]|uniref:TetR/AcrR family transcriptional regulator n=1 Tax=Clostridium symbiosum TaxID=1512 RepID=UPI0025A436AB|nr:TetR/AcrR family transcriptional regulator [[Clostridium] symbiosum]MDM8136472.1 TetR/AcrR family transcriptional regulator [[Clostridium] symbiosum]MDM8140549.1 TetR/AcrR family transcriptional regulator [[Clostridium] symbiosum]MDM8320557.1 TetR/AcrR family transcriptional regulator [[Clostridium] symbiosum]
MGRQNKKEAIATLHKEQIMKAAERLFSEKGFAPTTINDISKASEYSRRTIYAYYESKEDILHHIVEKGLLILKQNIEDSIKLSEDFMEQYKGICIALSKYQNEYSHSANNVNSANSSNLDFNSLSDTVKHILVLGTEINNLLAGFIEVGMNKGIVRSDVNPMMTVYILWSNIDALLVLAQTKGKFIAKQFSISESDFLAYGFRQIINSILKERI